MGRTINRSDRLRFIEEMDRKWYRKYRRKNSWRGWDEIIEHPHGLGRPSTL